MRSLAAERDEPLCVIGDLCGPKIRLGDFADGPSHGESGRHGAVRAGRLASAARRN